MMITSLILSIETTLSQAVLSIPNYTRARVCVRKLYGASTVPFVPAGLFITFLGATLT